MSNELESGQALLLLGEIKGLVQGLKDGQTLTNQRLDQQATAIAGLDKRLRTVEQKAAVMGAGAGAAVSLGVAMIVEGVKMWLAKVGSGG